MVVVTAQRTSSLGSALPNTSTSVLDSFWLSHSTGMQLERAEASLNNVKKKRTRRKVKRKNGTLRPRQEGSGDESNDLLNDVEIEYVSPDIFDPSDAQFAEFKEIFEKFAASALRHDSVIHLEDDSSTDKSSVSEQSRSKGDGTGGSLEDLSAETADVVMEKDLSKKKARKANRMTIAELKQLIKHPEVVEAVDVTATDPVLLAHLKSVQHSVPVPSHWSQKRKYLQGKRGIEKPPFELPAYIRDTGIMEMRQASREREALKSLKQKTRERLVPKLGKINIDYEKLHDAFFRFQTKPARLSVSGDLYYEGREYEVKFGKEKKPGFLSEELRMALGMTVLAPPPWLLNMQRYGPPPSYPHLKIPGLNAPIPESAQWGYQAGGWGKPPVDEFNRPLYGDVFGLMKAMSHQDDPFVLPPDKQLWGALEVDSFMVPDVMEGEHDLNEYEQEYDEEDHGEMQAPLPPEPITSFSYDEQGMATPSGMSSIASGLTTPDHIQLRKDMKRTMEAEFSMEPKSLYQVLPTHKASITSGMLATQHVYQVPGLSAPKTMNKASVQVALTPDDVDSLDNPTALAAKYDLAAHVSFTSTQKPPSGTLSLAKEDLGDMVASHAAQQAQKKKAKEASASTKKTFKF